MPAQTPHTPGPWTTEALANIVRVVHAVDPQTGFGDDIARLGSVQDKAEWANARLIAAAPELLAAAALALRDLREFMPTVSAEAITALEAAIAKAEGR